MGKKNGKQVRVQECRLPDGKKPRVHMRHDETKPSWRFSSVDSKGPFAWPKGAPGESAILAKLHDFDSMSWADIEGHRHHAIQKEALSREAIRRLEEIGQDDVDEVFSFALGGKPRIICIRAGGVAKLLWYDPEHKVCPSKLKHT